MSLVASDIIRFSRNPLLALNVLGFLFSVPLMCYILAYVIFVPIAKELAARLDNPSISTATALALGAVALFNLVYPSPVVISAAEELLANVDRLLILGLIISVPTSIAGYLYSKNLEKFGTAGFSNRVKEKTTEVQEKASGIYIIPVERPSRFEAYSPIFFPLLLVLLQTGFEHPHSVLTFLGNPNIALLIGVLLSIFSGRNLGSLILRELIEKAVRRSGFVLLDLCGGGALGATLAMTGTGEALGRFFLQLSLPHILVPFLISAALQTVQGSRIVTMLIVSPLLLPLVPELGLPTEIIILSMASGTFLISHVNDPFFWIFGELAELKPSEVFRSNTFGSALMGIVSFLLISTVYIFFY